MLRYLTVAVCLMGLAAAELTKIGEINSLQHGVGGTLWAKDNKHLVIKGFTVGFI